MDSISIIIERPNPSMRPAVLRIPFWYNSSTEERVVNSCPSQSSSLNKHSTMSPKWASTYVPKAGSYLSLLTDVPMNNAQPSHSNAITLALLLQHFCPITWQSQSMTSGRISNRQPLQNRVNNCRDDQDEVSPIANQSRYRKHIG
jgi:hypothetical protein